MLEVRSGAFDDGADVCVVGVGADRELALTGLPEDFAAGLNGFLEASDFSGKPGEIAVVPGAGLPYGRIVLAGVGGDPDAEGIRKAAGNAARTIKVADTVATTLHMLEVEGAAEAVAMGTSLGAYAFTRHRSEPKPAGIETLVLVEASEPQMEAAQRGSIIAAGVIRARDLINEPPAAKSPTTMAEIALGIGDEVGVRVRVYDEDEARAEGFGGLLGVAAGSAEPPRMVEFWYEPDDAEAFLAVVGKGIVFDSGGLSLKTVAGMETMKTDMSGAAAVFGAVETIARLGLPIKVVGITPLTENMPGGSAQRPGDVLTARNGKTIEVLNTDAEGRLVLADGLSLAAESEPDLIVDLATLTGACHVALGGGIAGLFGTGDAPDRVAEAAEAAGERVWPMPLPSDYRKLIDSDVADMRNSSTSRYGGAITAALLLKEFVGDVPWAHLDIAGPARASEAKGYVTKGGTGFGVRTVVELARRLCA